MWKTRMKILLCILFFLLFLPSLKSFAHSEDEIQFIDIEADIQENGSAIITENWITKAIEIPEYAKYMPNVSENLLQNLTIKDEVENIELEKVANWNELTDEEKKNKFAICERENGVEIYWNGEEPGIHTYTLKYIATSFVKQFTDKQGMYFDFFTDNLFPTPYGIQITVKAPFEFSNNNIKILKCGFEGNIEIEKGKIIIKDITAFKTMTLLGELKNNFFKIETKTDNSFKELKKELGFGNLIIEKKEDRIIIGILIFVSVLYIFLDIYHLKGIK